jgi:hypothetical protein
MLMIFFTHIFSLHIEPISMLGKNKCSEDWYICYPTIVAANDVALHPAHYVLMMSPYHVMSADAKNKDENVDS